MDEARDQSLLSPEQFETILNALPEAVCTVDREFLITSFNRAAERVSGVRRDEAIGRHCYDLFRSAACESNCPLAELLGGGPLFRRRAPAAFDRRHERTARCSCLSVLRDDRGRVVGAAATFRDSATADGAPPAPDAGLSMLAQSERRVIQEVLQRHDWNRAAACQELGLSRTTLWRKMRKLSIHP